VINPDKIRKLYIDGDLELNIFPDDFIVAIGKTKSNSVYHVVESVRKENGNRVRYNLKVMKSDLQTLIKRSYLQLVIPIQWYSRKK